MRSLRDVKRCVSRAEVRPRPEVNKAVLDDLLRELAAATEDTTSGAAPPCRQRTVRSSLMRVAAAAGVAIVALLGLGRLSQEPPPVPPAHAQVSAAEMLTVGRLNAAYRRGGFEAIDQLCQEADRRLGTEPERISVRAFARELKGT